MAQVSHAVGHSTRPSSPLTKKLHCGLHPFKLSQKAPVTSTIHSPTPRLPFSAGAHRSEL